MTLNNILVSYLSLINLSAFGCPEPPQEIKVFSQAEYISFVTVFSTEFISLGGPPRSFGGKYLFAGQVKTFKIEDANSEQSMTYIVRIHGLDIFDGPTFYDIRVMKSELPVCIKIYGSILSPNYVKENCEI